MLTISQTKILKYLFIFVDLSFIIYWTITYFHLIPNEFLFSDYNNPIVVNWNWSFLPIDLLISFTGITSIYLYNKQSPIWTNIALISLVLTLSSGLMAISYWLFKGEYNLTWWIPNLFLIFYPIYFIYHLAFRFKK